MCLQHFKPLATIFFFVAAKCLCTSLRKFECLWPMAGFASGFAPDFTKKTASDDPTRYQTHKPYLMYLVIIFSFTCHSTCLCWHLLIDRSHWTHRTNFLRLISTDSTIAFYFSVFFFLCCKREALAHSFQFSFRHEHFLNIFAQAINI